MTYHILNGDCLYESLVSSGFQGEFIVCRECLVDGPVSEVIDENFFDTRAEYISSAYNSTHSEYKSKVIDELSKLYKIKPDDEVYLWFEDDLFCQVNMWFIVSLLSEKNITNIYRIFPPADKDKFEGFANLSPEDLISLTESKVKFTSEDIQTGNDLWKAYCNEDFESLKNLSSSNSQCFRYLDEVLQAQIERYSLRPQKALKKILDSGEKNFNEIFSEFIKTESVYGFGDLQVKAMLELLIGEKVMNL